MWKASLVTMSVYPRRHDVGLYLVLYRKKLHTVYPMLYKPTLKNSKN